MKIIELSQLQRKFNSIKPASDKVLMCLPNVDSASSSDTNLEGSISTKPEKHSCQPTAEHKQGQKQLVAELLQNLLQKTIWFTVDNDFLIKVKLSKYLSYAEFYANKWSATKKTTSSDGMTKDKTGAGDTASLRIRKLRNPLGLW